MYLWTREQVSLWTHLENRLRLDSIKTISRSTAGNKVEAVLLIRFADSKCNCPFSICIESYFFFSVLLAEHCHMHGELLWQEGSAAGRNCGCNIPRDILESRFALRVFLPGVWSRCLIQTWHYRHIFMTSTCYWFKSKSIPLYCLWHWCLVLISYLVFLTEKRMSYRNIINN